MKTFREDLRAFIGSFRCALKGTSSAFRSQRNFRIHLAVAAVVLFGGAALGLNRQEFILLLLTVTLVLVTELVNTALEFAMDLVEARDHPVVRHAKDVSAGAVLMAVTGSVVVGALLLGPKLVAWCRR